ncbi:DsbA family oxidoreductase [Catenulispora subtropica]|uniref:DsbA family oxidoreductase n=1 Tax=Catenulispora subtropica TaxID=450798 RepID=A0ABP5D6K2_9ACTN
MRVEIWSDVACPWCYIGKARFEQGLEAFAHKDDVEVVFRSFELDPSLPKGTVSDVIPMLAKKYGMSLEQAHQAEARVAANAHDTGLDYILGAHDVGNTFDMHRLIHFAAEQGRQKELVGILFANHFADERSLFDDTRLLELAVEAGLDKDEAAAVLADETRYADAVRADEREAAMLGATGVPFFVLDRKFGVSGGQPAEVFTQALEEAWAARTPALKVVGEAPEGAVCGPDGCEIP